VADAPNDVGAAFAEETQRITADRFPIGGAAFILVLGLAWVFEHQTHPERDPTYAIVYGLEIAVFAVAMWLGRRPLWQRHTHLLAAVSAIAIASLVGIYNATVSSNAEVLTMALLYIVVGTMVLFPWGWRWQLAVAIGAIAVFVIAVTYGTLTATPLSMHVLGLGAIGALTVSASGYLARNRLANFCQAVDLRAANEALARANQALEDANRTKNEFLASVSHELRTPLNIILGYTDLLGDGEFGALGAEAQEAVERVGRTCRTLVFLISDLLDLSRIEAGQLAIRPARVELAAMFDDMRRFVEPRLTGKQVAFRTDAAAGLAVTADHDRVEQILVNLLSNAVKFTDHGEIRLQAHLDAGQMTIDVSDTGVGIDPAELPILFEPFRQGSAGKLAGGVGIGLSLSAQLAGAMGGSLTAASAVGRGSTFTLRLPASPT
jgi:signal transduction histidine kinase